jgi:antitoxin component YwqK of YwqJK toxin-antitoxin module
MRTFICLAVLFAALLHSCGDKKTTETLKSSPYPTSFEIYGNDTINLINNFGKQGLWRVFRFQTGTKLEEGKYMNDKKNGYWKRYSKKGALIDSVLYKNDQALY